MMQITDEMIEAFGFAFFPVNAVSKIEAEKEEIRSALEASFAAAKIGWQPIETAPNDGSKFIGFDGIRPFLCFSSQYYVKYPHEEGGPILKSRWSGDYYDCISPERPTHWMPLAKTEGTP